MRAVQRSSYFEQLCYFFVPGGFCFMMLVEAVTATFPFAL